jgi:outer membrane protein OmpU
MINYKTTITKENIMNKLKKIGLSALAGSLVATSAFAGEMAVGGSAKATWTDNGSDTSTGSGIGMNKLLTFTGSGEMDNGHNIKVYFGNNGTSQSSASMTYDMGDMGALTLDNGVGGHGIGSIDDKTPTANEEIWDNVSHGTGHDGYRVGVGNAGALAYTTTLGGLTVSADYLKQGGGTLEDGSTAGSAASTGTSRSVALTFAPADGVAAGVGMGEAGNAIVNNESNQLTGFVTYAAGPVSLGYQMSEEETQGAANWNTQQWGVTFNVSDNISIGYGERTVDFKIGGNNAIQDQEDHGVSASYTMGSMSIAGNMNKSNDTHGVLNSDNETTEIALSFAF